MVWVQIRTTVVMMIVALVLEAAIVNPTRKTQIPASRMFPTLGRRPGCTSAYLAIGSVASIKRTPFSEGKVEFAASRKRDGTTHLVRKRRGLHQG